MKKRRSVFGITRTLFRKYQQDSGNIIVSSISFYVLLTFIPFTLLSICVLGYIIDISDPAAYLQTLVRSMIPAPYDKVIISKVLNELNIIAVTRKLSGPLGLAFLFLFTMRLFAVIRPSFHLIFGRKPKSFFRGKGEELLLTFFFSAVQSALFFAWITSLVVQTRFTQAFGGFVAGTPIGYVFSFLMMCLVFLFFYLLYYVLTPVRNKKLLLMSAAPAVIIWYAGRYLFKYFILSLGRYTAFFGAYGAFIAFLLWVYFSTFVFVLCAELLSILSVRARCKN